MPTNACVAFTTKGNCWQANSVFWNGSPPVLGKRLWKVLQGQLAKDTNYPTNALRLFIATYHKGQPVDWTFFNDAERQKITSQNPDPLFLDYVYLLNPANLTLTILASKVSQLKAGVVHSKPSPKPKNGKWDYGHCWAWHEKVWQGKITDPEPNWEKIEKASQ